MAAIIMIVHDKLTDIEHSADNLIIAKEENISWRAIARQSKGAGT